MAEEEGGREEYRARVRAGRQPAPPHSDLADGPDLHPLAALPVCCQTSVLSPQAATPEISRNLAELEDGVGTEGAVMFSPAQSVCCP